MVRNHNSSPFSPIRLVGDKKKSTLVAEEIVGAISRNRLQPGDRLPSEREIADQMRVSRTVVREALSALRIVGIVNIHIGDGSYVARAISENNRLDEALNLLERNESPLEIWEARQALESTLASLSIQKAGNEDILKLEVIFQDMSNNMKSQNYEGYHVANKQFHCALLKTVDNSILYRIAITLLDMTDQLLTKEPIRRYLSAHLPHSLSKHEKILKAFRAKNSSQLSKAINRHFEELREFYLGDSL